MDVPEPRSISPALFKHAKHVFTWLEQDIRALWAGLRIVEPVMPKAHVFFQGPSDEGWNPSDTYFNEVYLRGRRAWGPAPWTDDPFHYEWKVAQGPPGYWAATDTEVIRTTWDY